jgi:hypothetical protein
MGKKNSNGKVNNTKEKAKQQQNFSLLSKSSGLTPLVSKSGIGAWYWALWGRVLPLLSDSLGRETTGKLCLQLSFV